jgi:hypothetical protein
MTKVINLNTSAEPYCYIGRGSPFGNPFRIGVGGTREEVIEKYRRYFYARIAEDKQFKEDVLSLKGKILGCFCKPLPCHGDIVVEYLDEL